MQVSQICALTDAAGNILEPPGIRILYMEDGYQFEETRRPADAGNVKRTIRNVTTGEQVVSVVAANTLPAV